jgi:hypothetical protein
MVGFLTSCSKEGGIDAYPAATGVRAAESAQKSPPVLGTPELPGVVDYGPKEAEVGKSFNVQANGSSAMWFRMNRSLDGGRVTVVVGGRTSPAVIDGTLLTTTVPAELIAKPGVIPVVITIGSPSEASKSMQIELRIH